MSIFALLILFQIKHFGADFLLQGKYMMGKFNRDWSFFWPLAAHAGVNGLYTLVICLAVGPNFWWLALVDTVTHFFIDRLKAGQNYLGRFKLMSSSEMNENMEFLKIEHALGQEYDKNILKAIRHNSYFWLALGFDQALHQLVYIFIIAVLMNAI
ncbi:MAG: DUF3307 domain-containing protein [Patescibacteria group bacterium]